MTDRASGQWLPYNMDRTQHDCRNQKQTILPAKKTESSSPDKDKKITPEAKAWVREILEGPKIKELEARLKRVESIVIGPQK